MRYSFYIILFVTLLNIHVSGMEQNNTLAENTIIKFLETSFKKQDYSNNKSLSLEPLVQELETIISNLNQEYYTAYCTSIAFLLENDDTIQRITDALVNNTIPETYADIAVLLNTDAAYQWLEKELKRLLTSTEKKAIKTSYKEKFPSIYQDIAQWKTVDYYRILNLINVAHSAKIYVRLPDNILIKTAYTQYPWLTTRKPMLCYFIDDALCHRNASYFKPKLDDSGKYEELILCIEGNKINLNITDNEKNSLLHWAAQRHHPLLGMMTFLLHYKVNINPINNKGNTPLHDAVTDIDPHSESHCRDLIQNRAHINMQNNQGDTPLHIVLEGLKHNYAKITSIKIANYLIEHKADITIKNNNGKTPQESATEHGITLENLKKRKDLSQ